MNVSFISVILTIIKQQLLLLRIISLCFLLMGVCFLASPIHRWSTKLLHQDPMDTLYDVEYLEEEMISSSFVSKENV